jgi:type IV secretion system protein VirB1
MDNPFVGSKPMMDLAHLAQQCAPTVAPLTLQAIIRAESGFNPLAINVNGGRRLARQATSRAQAASWAQWLVEHGYSIDVGLMQINSVNLRRLNISVQDAFEPCTNLRLGAQILLYGYQRSLRAGHRGRSALIAALSAYNTGDLNKGVRNGYVAKVMQASAPPLLPARPSGPALHPAGTPSPNQAHSAVAGFAVQPSTIFTKVTSW